MAESKINFSLLGKLWEKQGGAAAVDQTPKEPPKEEPRAAEAPRNIYSLSDEQEAYINRTKAEIIEQLYTIDDTSSLLLKALGVMCVCLNDKAYYKTVGRLIKNVWGQGLGKIRSLEEIPGEFILSEISRNMATLEADQKEKQLDAQAKEDIATARAKLEAKGKRIYKTLPETSKAAFISFGESDAQKRP